MSSYCMSKNYKPGPKLCCYDMFKMQRKQLVLNAPFSVISVINSINYGYQQQKLKTKTEK